MHILWLPRSSQKIPEASFNCSVVIYKYKINFINLHPLTCSPPNSPDLDPTPAPPGGEEGVNHQLLLSDEWMDGERERKREGDRQTDRQRKSQRERERERGRERERERDSGGMARERGNQRARESEYIRGELSLLPLAGVQVCFPGDFRATNVLYYVMAVSNNVIIAGSICVLLSGLEGAVAIDI